MSTKAFRKCRAAVTLAWVMVVVMGGVTGVWAVPVPTATVTFHGFPAELKVGVNVNTLTPIPTVVFVIDNDESESGDRAFQSDMGSHHVNMAGLVSLSAHTGLTWGAAGALTGNNRIYTMTLTGTPTVSVALPGTITATGEIPEAAMTGAAPANANLAFTDVSVSAPVAKGSIALTTVSGVTRPATGVSAVTGSISMSNTNTSANTIQWFAAGSTTAHTESFEGVTVYRARVTLKAVEHYMFPAAPTGAIVVADGDVTTGPGLGRTDENTYVFDVTFPMTAPPAVTGTVALDDRRFVLNLSALATDSLYDDDGPGRNIRGIQYLPAVKMLRVTMPAHNTNTDTIYVTGNAGTNVDRLEVIAGTTSGAGGLTVVWNATLNSTLTGKAAAEPLVNISNALGSGIVLINSGSAITAASGMAIKTNNGAVVMSGGSVTASVGTAIDAGTAAVTVSGGTLTATLGTAVKTDGAVTITGASTIVAGGGGVVIDGGAGAITVDDATIRHLTTNATPVAATDMVFGAANAITLTDVNITGQTDNTTNLRGAIAKTTSSGSIVIEGGRFPIANGPALVTAASGNITIRGAVVRSSVTDGWVVHAGGTGSVTLEGIANNTASTEVRATATAGNPYVGAINAGTVTIGSTDNTKTNGNIVVSVAGGRGTAINSATHVVVRGGTSAVQSAAEAPRPTITSAIGRAIYATGAVVVVNATVTGEPRDSVSLIQADSVLVGEHGTNRNTRIAISGTGNVRPTAITAKDVFVRGGSITGRGAAISASNHAWIGDRATADAGWRTTMPPTVTRITIEGDSVAVYAGVDVRVNATALGSVISQGTNSSTAVNTAVRAGGVAEITRIDTIRAGGASTAVEITGTTTNTDSILLVSGVVRTATGTAIKMGTGAGRVLVRGGSVITGGGANSAAIDVNGGMVNVWGGTVQATGAGPAVYASGSDGVVNVGTVASGTSTGDTLVLANTGSAIILSTAAEATIAGGKVRGSGANLDGSTIRTINAIATAPVTVSGGVIEALNETGSAAAINAGTGNVAVTGGTITSRGATGRGILTNGDGDITVTGATVVASGTNGVALDAAFEGEITVTGSVIRATGSGAASRAIRARGTGTGTAGNVTINPPAGDNDSTVVSAVAGNAIQIDTVAGAADQGKVTVLGGATTNRDIIIRSISGIAVNSPYGTVDIGAGSASASKVDISTVSGTAVVGDTVGMARANGTIRAIGNSTTTLAGTAVSARSFTLTNGTIVAGNIDEDSVITIATGVTGLAGNAGVFELNGDSVLVHGAGRGIWNANADIDITVGNAKVLTGDGGTAIRSAGKIDVTNAGSRVTVGRAGTGIYATGDRINIEDGEVKADTLGTAIRSTAAAAIDTIAGGTVTVANRGIGLDIAGTVRITNATSILAPDSLGTAIRAGRVEVLTTTATVAINSRDIGIIATDSVIVPAAVTAGLAIAGVVDANITLRGVINTIANRTTTIAAGRRVNLVGAAARINPIANSTLRINGTLDVTAAGTQFTNTADATTIIGTGGNLAFRTTGTTPEISFKNAGKMVLSVGSLMNGASFNFQNWADSLTGPIGTERPRVDHNNASVVIPPTLAGFTIRNAANTLDSAVVSTIRQTAYSPLDVRIGVDSLSFKHKGTLSFTHVSGNLPVGRVRLEPVSANPPIIPVAIPARDSLLQLVTVGDSGRIGTIVSGLRRGTATAVTPAAGVTFRVRVSNEAGHFEASERNLTIVVDTASPVAGNFPANLDNGSVGMFRGHYAGYVVDTSSTETVNRRPLSVVGTAPNAANTVVYTGQNVLRGITMDSIRVEPFTYHARYTGLGTASFSFLRITEENPNGISVAQPVNAGVYAMRIQTVDATNFANILTPREIGRFAISPAKLSDLLENEWLVMETELPEKRAIGVNVQLADVARFGAAYSVASNDGGTMIDGEPTVEGRTLSFDVTDQTLNGDFFTITLTVDGGNIDETANTVTVTVRFKDDENLAEPMPAVLVSWESETITGFLVDGREYTIGLVGGATQTVSEVNNVAIDEEWFGKSVEVIALPRYTWGLPSIANVLNIPVRPAFPATLVENIVTVNSSLMATDGRINGVTNQMEWRAEGDENWTRVVGTSVTGLAPDVYEIRMAASTINVEGSFASYAIEVTVGTDVHKEATPDVAINFLSEILTGFTTGRTYTVNGDDVTVSTAGTVAIDAEWMGYADSVRVILWPVTPGQFSVESDEQVFFIPARRAAPEGLAGVDTDYGVEEGAITGITAGMEWRIVDGTWAATAATDLAAGGYEVRYAATATAFASLATAVTIGVNEVEVQEATPDVAINFAAETLTGFVTGSSYEVNGVAVTLTGATLAIDPEWLDSEIAIVTVARAQAGHIVYIDSDAQELEIPARSAAPTGLVAVDTDFEEENGAITGVTDAMEWRAAGGMWRTTAATGLGAGVYNVRYAATATAFASAIANVTIGINEVEEQEATPDVAINFAAETLTGFVSGSNYAIDGDDVTITNGTLPVGDMIGSTVAIVTVAKAQAGHIVYIDSDAQSLVIPARLAAPTGLTTTADTTNNATRTGAIHGVAAGMQYRLGSTGDWIAITGTSVTGLASGDYQVRVAATATAFASATTTVTIGTAVSVNEGNRDLPGDGDIEVIVVPTVPVSGEFTVGPNVVAKSDGSVTLFWNGVKLVNGTLNVFDATGNLIASVNVSDVSSNTDRRAIGSWNLTDRSGRPVSEGTYLIRGVLTTEGQKTQRVSSVIVVR
ncbi:MAG: hypothetical protein LBC70_05405 [Chitinispirillales bacterium]|jgi:hypothetical protein|nr:hypothetical protein [Chitinispirillales bacterium]